MNYLGYSFPHWHILQFELLAHSIGYCHRIYLITRPQKSHGCIHRPSRTLPWKMSDACITSIHPGIHPSIPILWDSYPIHTLEETDTLPGSATVLDEERDRRRRGDAGTEVWHLNELCTGREGACLGGRKGRIGCTACVKRWLQYRDRFQAGARQK